MRNGPDRLRCDEEILVWTKGDECWQHVPKEAEALVCIGMIEIYIEDQLGTR